MTRACLLLMPALLLGLPACGGDRIRRTTEPEPEPVATCGDGRIDENEQCDGSNLLEETCETQGFDTGTLLCSDSCQFVTSQCVRRCGNGQIDLGEACDGSLGPLACATFGAKSCTAACEIDESTCVSEPYASGPPLDVDPGGRSVLTDLTPGGTGDLVYAVDPPSRLAIYRYTSPSGFGNVRILSKDAIPLEPFAADLNGDGRMDLAAIHADGSAAGHTASGEGFVEEPLLATTSGCGAAEWVGALGPATAPRLVALGCGDRSSGFGGVLILQRGVEAQTVAPMDPIVLEAAALGDATLDGNADILVSTGSEVTAIVEGVDGWAFGPSFTLDASAEQLSLADLDGDGDADLVTGNAANVITYERTPTGFVSRREFTAGGSALLKTTDLDGDGRIDLLWLDATQNAIEIRRNAGDFTFSAYSVAVTVEGAGDLHTGDVDGDRDADLVYTRTIGVDGSRAAVFLNQVR